ncbi:MAG: phosphate acetyltransferase [Calditrichaeota bacterium]|nr:MAG: phosphate acetyltransferase [Calditrichota bacterium]
MNVIEEIQKRASENLKQIVFPESTDERVLHAAEQLYEKKLVIPVLIGDEGQTLAAAEKVKADISGIQIIDPLKDSRRKEYIQRYYQKRKHKGVDLIKAEMVMQHPLFYAAMAVHDGRADASVAGCVETTSNVLRAAIQIIGTAEEFSVVSSTFLMVLKDGTPLTYGDCGVVPDPDEQQLAEIAIASAESHKKLTGQKPVVALLSFSTKGSAEHALVDKVRKATQIAQNRRPDLLIDGEMQADAALVPYVANKKAPGSLVAGKANVLIFPDLNAGNIAYKLTERVAGATALGPLLQGLAKPANDLSRGCKAEDIVNVACICSVKAN